MDFAVKVESAGKPPENRGRSRGGRSGAGLVGQEDGARAARRIAIALEVELLLPGRGVENGGQSDCCAGSLLILLKKINERGMAAQGGRLITFARLCSLNLSMCEALELDSRTSRSDLLFCYLGAI